MPSSRTRRGLRAAFAALALPAALAAQDPATVPQEDGLPAQEELQAWLAEIQEIHGKLEDLQHRALQDPALLASQDSLGASIKAAMDRADPTLHETMARVPALEAEAQAAQQAGDHTRLEALGTEAEQIQVKFAAAQQHALQQPALAAQLQAFQRQLEAGMLSVDPSAPQLISRYQELEARLAILLGTGPQ